MKPKKKKTPADYPIFSFRCSKEDKEWISNLLDRLEVKFNESADEGDILIRRNDIIIGAIKQGLNLMTKVKRIKGDK
jgi:hypothetical protein